MKTRNGFGFISTISCALLLAASVATPAAATDSADPATVHSIEVTTPSADGKHLTTLELQFDDGLTAADAEAAARKLGADTVALEGETLSATSSDSITEVVPMPTKSGAQPGTPAQPNGENIVHG